MESKISMDGGREFTDRSLVAKFAKEGWPKMPNTLEWDGKGKYINTFCLGCKQTGLDLSKVIHTDDPECNGALVIIHKDFTPPVFDSQYPPDYTSEQLAKKCVEKEIEKLITDKGYLQALREKFKGFNIHYKGEEMSAQDAEKMRLECVGMEMVAERKFMHKGIKVEERIYIWDNCYKLIWCKAGSFDVTVFEGKVNPLVHAEFPLGALGEEQEVMARHLVRATFDSHWFSESEVN